MKYLARATLCFFLVAHALIQIASYSVNGHGYRPHFTGSPDFHVDSFIARYSLKTD